MQEVKRLDDWLDARLGVRFRLIERLCERMGGSMVEMLTETKIRL